MLQSTALKVGCLAVRRVASCTNGRHGEQDGWKVNIKSIYLSGSLEFHLIYYNEWKSGNCVTPD